MSYYFIFFYIPFGILQLLHFLHNFHLQHALLHYDNSGLKILAFCWEFLQPHFCQYIIVTFLKPFQPLLKDCYFLKYQNQWLFPNYQLQVNLFNSVCKPIIIKLFFFLSGSFSIIIKLSLSSF